MSETTAIDSWPNREAERREKTAAFVLLALGLLLRVVEAWGYRIDSDEPQHLHVVWGWLHGQMQHRDFFDNHMPLFHVLCVPLLALIGERPDGVVWARLGMIPIYCASIWGIYLIGIRVRSPRVALWGMVFAALESTFFLRCLEFRADDLWALLWIWSIAILVDGRMSWRRAGLAGLTLGAMTCVSMKSSLLLVALAGAIATAAAFARRDRALPSFGILAGWLAAGFVGFAVVPAAIAAFYAARGAWQPFLYDVIYHNMVTDRGGHQYHRLPVRAECAVFGAFALPWIVRQARRRPDAPTRAREVVAFGANGLYMYLLFLFWPVWTGEDYPPFLPFVALYLAPFALKLAGLVRARLGRVGGMGWVLRLGAPTWIGVLQLVLILCFAPFWRLRSHGQTQLVRDVLALTAPGEAVADGKGETVYRRRSSYYVLEPFTRARMHLRLLRDDIPERLVVARTAVICPAPFTSSRERGFVRANYVPVTKRLAVLGQMLSLPGASLSRDVSFDVVIPEQYVMVDRKGVVPGEIDGRPAAGPVTLAAGHHRFHPGRAYDGLAFAWARAVQRGFSPFAYAEKQAQKNAKKKTRMTKKSKRTQTARASDALMDLSCSEFKL